MDITLTDKDFNYEGSLTTPINGYHNITIDVTLDKVKLGDFLITEKLNIKSDVEILCDMVMVKCLDNESNNSTINAQTVVIERYLSDLKPYNTLNIVSLKVSIYECLSFYNNLNITTDMLISFDLVANNIKSRLGSSSRLKAKNVNINYLNSSTVIVEHLKCIDLDANTVIVNSCDISHATVKKIDLTVHNSESIIKNLNADNIKSNHLLKCYSIEANSLHGDGVLMYKDTFDVKNSNVRNIIKDNF